MCAASVILLSSVQAAPQESSQSDPASTVVQKIPWDTADQFLSSFRNAVQGLLDRQHS